MGNTLAQPRLESSPLVLPAWKNLLGWTSALLLALLFLVAGVWKLTEPYEAASRMIQAKVPAPLGLFTAVSFGIAETFAALLLVIPRFRRWGAILIGLMLIAFMLYIGYFYDALRGEECSCFPWLKRAVGPGFFIGDGIMLLMALAAGRWTRPSEGLRGAFLALGAISVFAMASFGINFQRQNGAKAPDSIMVDGSQLSLGSGRVFLYFFDPECSHCLIAGRELAKHKWPSDIALVAIPTVNPQFAKGFLQDTGMEKKFRISTDLEKLKAAFPFTAGPYAVAVEHGHQKQSFLQFEAAEPAATLKKIGFIANE